MIKIITTHSSNLVAECTTTEQETSCLPAEEVSQVEQEPPAKHSVVETPFNHPPVTPVSEQGPENMEVETREATPSVEEEASPELLKSSSDGMSIAEQFSTAPPKLPASPTSAEPAECLPMSETSPCQGPQFSSPSSSVSANAQEAPSTLDMEGRLLPHSEEDEEEEDDDEQMKGEEHILDIKQEAQECEVKPEFLLDEMSVMSHGDESSSGFLGSPGEPDPQLSMELGLISGGRSHTDNLLTETDDSLPFEPFRSDREKAKRRGSPGRSRVKQVRSVKRFTHASVVMLCLHDFTQKLFFSSLQGRSNSFPGKRRPRGGGGGRGRGGRSRLKAMASCIDAFLVSDIAHRIHVACKM